MKKLILLLFFWNLSNAQDCKFITNEIDEFTKVKKVKTKDYSLSEGKSGVLRFALFKGNSTYLCMEYYTSQVKAMVVGVNHKISIMLKDDVIIELLPNDVYSGELSTVGSTTLRVKYNISLSELEKMRNIGIKKIRFNTTKYYYDFDVVKEKWIKSFNEGIDCFLNEIKTPSN